MQYTLTLLHAAAQAFVQHLLSPEVYGRMMEEWRAATSVVLAQSIRSLPQRALELSGESPGADQGKDEYRHEGGKHPERGGLCGRD